MKLNIGKKPYGEKAAFNFMFSLSLLVWKQTICNNKVRGLTFNTGVEVDCVIINCLLHLFALAVDWIRIS